MTDDAFSQSFEIVGGDFGKAGQVATRVKSILKEVGIEPSIVRRASIAVYEAEMNVVCFARRGILRFTVGPEVIEVVVKDEGEGIPDIELAMREGYSTAPEEIREMGFGAGMGLPNIKKSTDALEITSTVGDGTRVDFMINLQPDRAGHR